MSNILPCTLPLGPNEFKTLMTDKDTVFLVDLTQSKLKSHKANIAFLANANVPAMLDFNQGEMTDEFLNELMMEYITTPNVVDIEPLPNILAKIVLYALQIENYISVPRRITEEWIKQFLSVEERKQEIIKVIAFIDSTLYVFHPEFKDKTAEDLENWEYIGPYPIIEDRNVIGKSIPLLFNVPDFTILFASIPPDENVYYFKYQFEDYMFRNQHLSHYYNVPNNHAAQLFNYLSNVDVEELERLSNEDTE